MIGFVPVCRASYTFIGPPAPSCNSITVSPTSGNIPLRSSVSCSTTNATTVSIACGNGQIINNGTGSCLYANTGIFTPTCTVNGTITNPACQGTVTATNPVAGSPILSIKKFANNADGQTISDALPLTPGASFTYRYVVSNSGTVAATGVVVTDTFPQYVTVGTIVPPSGWTCNKGTKTLTGVTYPTVICTTPSLAANTSVTITINEVLSLTTPLNTQIRNIVFVCKNGDTTIPNCSSTCIDPANPACTPPPPPPNCDPIPGSPNYDPACVITPPSS